MSTRAKKEKRLQKAGYITKKGQFGAIRSMRGGSEYNDMTFNNFKKKADEDMMLGNINKHKFLLHTKDKNGKSMFHHFLARTDSDGEKIVE